MIRQGTRTSIVCVGVRYVVRSLRSLFETAAFWTAIALPFLYVPFLVVGLDTQSETIAFFGSLCVHLLALTIGASHHSE